MTSSPIVDDGGGAGIETTLVAVNLGYEVGSKRILSDVTASFKPRQLTALMGCSGAGKTTLLNTLAGRSAGNRTGDILMNGVPTTPERMRLSLSYMPQDDDLYLQLTVRQLLYYSALMRCPRSSPGGGAPPQNKRSRADEIMSKLGILHVADNLVAEVSGGQKKRVSAAIEFLSTRPLLFMDEPTSGLDSATAMSLVETLRKSARDETRTVISTIHQPSWTLMCTFDSVVLLGTRSGDKGGTVVYRGSPRDLPAYFGARGSPVPPGTNPADHLMYVLKEQGGDKWAERWLNSNEDDTAAAEEEMMMMTTTGGSKSRSSRRGDSFYLGEKDGRLPSSPCSETDYPISYAEQYRILFLRSLYLWMYDKQQGPLILKLLFAVNVMIVLLLTGMPPNLSKAETLLFFAVTQYTMALSPLVILMPEERAIVLREYRNGVFSAPVYWFARVTVVVLHSLIVATFTTLFTYPLCGFPVTPFPSKLLLWWSSQALYVSSLMILGLTIGILVPTALAGVKAIAAILIPWIATAGITPPLSMVRPTVFYLHYPNLISWEVKLALTIAFTNDGDKARDTLVNGVKIHPGNANSCFLALVIMFFALFFLGLLATHHVLNRPDKVAGLRASTKNETPQDGRGKHRSAAASSRDLENPSQTSNYGAIGQTTTTIRSVPIELKEVTYMHPSSGAKQAVKKKAIDSVSVSFSPGSVSVLMGPSGAGKSTMLNLLSGRLPGGTFINDLGEIQPCLQGDVLVDDRPVVLSAFKRLGTLTPQDDLLNEILTVHQTLVYAAELRSPRHWSHSRKLARVDAVMKELGLQHNAHNVVGNAAKVGISGGQKKRLSIGVDLLAELPIVLVDEPTTGLDAASALDVVECLVSLAVDQHRTVICTVHQPPWSTVLKFDRLVVLASGKVVYDAPPSSLPNFLAKSMHSEVPENHNPADHMMDLLVNHQPPPPSPTKKSNVELSKLSSPTKHSAITSPEDGNHDDHFSSYAVSEWTQFTILLRRFSYIFVVDEDQLPDVFIPGCIVTLINGLTFHNFPVNKYVGGGILYNVIAHGMICSNGVVLNIPNERLLVLREYRNGAYSIRAYWFARCTVAIWVVVLMGIPWLAIWYSLVGFPARFAPIAHTYFASTLNAVVLALMAGVVGLLSHTQLAAGQVFTPIGDVQTIFAGLIITKHFIKPYMLPIFYALPISYAYEIISTAIFELKGEKGEEILAYYDLHPSNRHTDYVVLFVMVAFWLGAGFYVATLEISGEPPRLDLVSSTENLAVLWGKAEGYLAYIDHYAKHNAFWYHRGIQPDDDPHEDPNPSVAKNKSQGRNTLAASTKTTTTSHAAASVVSRSDSNSFLTDDSGCD